MACKPPDMSAAEGAGRAGDPSRLSPWWLRAFLLVNVVQDFAIGVIGLLSPANSRLPLKDLTPLNARFICALYFGGGTVILLAALVRYAIDARIALYAFFVITVLVLAMTVAYWSDFTVDGVPWLWMFTYVADPILVPVVLTALDAWRPFDPGRHRLTALFWAQAAVFGVTGLLLLVAPDTAIDVWPWALTPLLARVYAAFFLAFAVGAVLSAGERRTQAFRPFLAGSLVLVVTTLVVSLIHLDRFASGPSTWVWFGLHLAGIVLFASALVSVSRPRTSVRPATAEP